MRLTMLAFLTTVFKAPGQKILYGWVNERLRETRAEGGIWRWEWGRCDAAGVGVDSGCVYGVWDDEGVGAGFVEGDDEREGVKAELRWVMWIELVHDRSGSAAFEELEYSVLA